MFFGNRNNLHRDFSQSGPGSALPLQTAATFGNVVPSITILWAQVVARVTAQHGNQNGIFNITTIWVYVVAPVAARRSI